MGNQSKGQQTTAKRQPDMTPVDALMREAVSDGVFPGAVLLASREDGIVWHRAYGLADIFAQRVMTIDTLFDLASLTKPLATALSVMILVQQGLIGTKQELGEILPAFKETQKANIKVEHLLYHTSGLADYRPYYNKVGHLPAENRKAALRGLLASEPLINPIGRKVIYSDLGFMILEWIIEHVSGKRLDCFASEMIYNPLGVDPLFFVDLNTNSKRHIPFAATEQCPWREILLSGQVHDENTYVVGGIEGHAGLFGTAAAVYMLVRTLLSAYHGTDSNNLFQTKIVRSFFKRLPKSDKALGFDMPSLKDSSAGHHFSANSVGHLGFTGTSFWMDLDRSIIVILLTNRIHPSRDNVAIKAFRPGLHDAVMQCLLNRHQKVPVTDNGHL
ncbi:MAG: serine hydrolase [Desulfobacterales bacterium]|jgi:CubicO group peptidase (beta-lactamase class C family)